MSARFCTNCGAPIQLGDQFCTGCGSRLPEPTQAREDSERIAKVRKTVEAGLAGCVGAYKLLPDGSYLHQKEGGAKIRVFVTDDIFCLVRLAGVLGGTDEGLDPALAWWLVEKQSGGHPFGRARFLKKEGLVAIEHVLVGDYLDELEFGFVHAVFTGFVEECLEEMNQMRARSPG